MKRVYHVCGNSRNYGDMALVSAMQREIASKTEQILGQSVLFEDIDVKKPSPITRNTVDLMNKHGDMLLIGGGGMVMKGDGFQTRSGWQLNISLEDLKALKIPIVVYGIGYNAFEMEHKSFTVDTVTHLKTTQRLSRLFSVRDKGSKDALMGLGLREMEVIPDPAMFCSAYSPQIPEIDSEKLLIGLNLAGDRPESRFPKGHEDSKITYLARTLRDYLDHRGGGKVVYFPHCERYDLRYEELLREILEQRFFSISDIEGMFPENSASTPLLAGIYSKMSAVVGVRGHSNIIPYGQNVPTIGLGNHVKNGFFASETGMHNTDFTLMDLDYKLDQYIYNSAVRSEMNYKTSRFYDTLNEFNEKVVSVLWQTG